MNTTVTPRRRVPRRRKGISLIEVLVVIGVIMMLLAMLIPGLGAVRERARRTVCKNNLKQWGLALGYYQDDNNDCLPKEGT